MDQWYELPGKFSIKEALWCLDHVGVSEGDADQCLQYIDSIISKVDHEVRDGEKLDLLDQVKEKVRQRTDVYIKSALKR